MPEGPEIRQAADKIAAAVMNSPVEEVFFAFEHLKPYEDKLAHRSIKAVEARGKALLIRFDNQLNIYSHNQLYGKWMIRKAYNYPQTKRQLRLAIHNHQRSALLYSASDIEVLQDDELEIHPFLSRLGLDVLDPNLKSEKVFLRLQQKEFCRRRLINLFLDQHFLAGNGNYLRSEILFVAKLYPMLRPVDCSEEQLRKLAIAAVEIPQQSYRTKGITNDVDLAQKLKAQGYRYRDYRHWVFAREGKSCFVCGTPVVKEMTGGRRYYFCPQCQMKE